MSIPKVKTSNLLLGELKDYVSDPLVFLMNQQKENGDVFKFRLAYRYLNFVNKPEYVKQILQKNHTSFVKSLAYRKLKLLLGNGLFTNEGESWLENRRLIQPAFHGKRIQAYFEIIKFHAYQLSTLLETKKEIDVGHQSTNSTLNIITDTLFGIVDDASNSKIEKSLPFALKYMVKRVTSSLNAPLWYPSKRNLKFKNVVNELKEIIFKIIENKKTQGFGDDLLSWLMQIQDAESEKKMTTTQLKDEILTFYLAGHETTSVSLTWGVYYLLKNETALLQLQNEIEQFDDLEKLTWEQVQSCKYLDLVIKEVLRKASPIWVLGREATKDVDFSDFKLNKGESVIFSPYMLHHHKDYWENPDEFNPDRFKGKVNDDAYLPFGAGPRQCIGNNFAIMELKVLLIYLFHKKKIKLEAEFPEYDYSLTLRPLKAVKISLN